MFSLAPKWSLRVCEHLCLVSIALSIVSCAGNLSESDKSRMAEQRNKEIYGEYIRGIKLINDRNYSEGEKVLIQMANADYYPAIPALVKLYDPEYGKLPDSEKYTNWLVKGANFSGAWPLQWKLADAYLKGQTQNRVLPHFHGRLS